MKLYRIIALVIMTLVTAGAAMAGTQYNDHLLTLHSDAGHLSDSETFQLTRLPNGDFSDTFSFYAGDLRSVIASLTTGHDIEFGSNSFLQDGEGHRTDLSGNSSNREGSLSGGHTGNFTLHVEGHIGGTSDHGEYNVHVTAVPEPETVAMMLAGLGVVGWASRRRTARAALTA